jgi:hypothetical protein
LISDTGNATSKPPWHGGALGPKETRRLMAVCLIAGGLAIAIAIAVSGGGSSSKLAADVTSTHRHPASLSGHIQAFLHASSVQELQCTNAGGGERSCQVEFSDPYGTWWANVVVKRHDVVRNPGGNANWLCASACTSLPKTTGLSRNTGTAGNGKVINDENRGVVPGPGGAAGGATATGGAAAGATATGGAAAGATATGDTGTSGVVDPTGATGDSGASGVVYATGATGDTGTGNTGANGVVTTGGGYTGTTGGG